MKKRYLVVTYDREDDETQCKFFDTYGKAYDFHTDCECGLGIECQVYELDKNGVYQLLFD